MRSPQHLIESLWFIFGTESEFLSAVAGKISDQEIEQISALSAEGLPPITSIEAVATMIGVNSGIVWSFIVRPERYYRRFVLENGRKRRVIMAPRVGLKVIQKWMSFHLSRVLPIHAHVFGFVPTRSHIDAAFIHRGAEWAYSVDIEDFFHSTPRSLVADALEAAGYSSAAAALVSRLSCVQERLAQGAPSSPALSNLVFYQVDAKLAAIAERHGAALSRFADDIVFSGKGQFPTDLKEQVHALFRAGPWVLAPHKERVEPIKGRIKIHGLIVNGPRVRTTKGYRNNLRAYRHILETKGAAADGVARLRGHLEYASQVDRRLDHLCAEGVPVPNRSLEISIHASLIPGANADNSRFTDWPSRIQRFLERMLSRPR